MSTISDEARAYADANAVEVWVAMGGLKRLLDEHEYLEDATEYFHNSPGLALYQQGLKDRERLKRIMFILEEARKGGYDVALVPEEENPLSDIYRVFWEEIK
jgi:hypothetical protein